MPDHVPIEQKRSDTEAVDSRFSEYSGLGSNFRSQGERRGALLRLLCKPPNIANASGSEPHAER